MKRNWNNAIQETIDKSIDKPLCKPTGIFNQNIYVHII